MLERVHPRLPDGGGARHGREEDVEELDEDVLRGEEQVLEQHEQQQLVVRRDGEPAGEAQRQQAVELRRGEGEGAGDGEGWS